MKHVAWRVKLQVPVKILSDKDCIFGSDVKRKWGLNYCRTFTSSISLILGPVYTNTFSYRFHRNRKLFFVSSTCIYTKTIKKWWSFSLKTITFETVSKVERFENDIVISHRTFMLGRSILLQMMKRILYYRVVSIKPYHNYWDLILSRKKDFIKIDNFQGIPVSGVLSLDFQ